MYSTATVIHFSWIIFHFWKGCRLNIWEVFKLKLRRTRWERKNKFLERNRCKSTRKKLYSQLDIGKDYVTLTNNNTIATNTIPHNSVQFKLNWRRVRLHPLLFLRQAGEKKEEELDHLVYGGDMEEKAVGVWMLARTFFTAAMQRRKNNGEEEET